MTAPGGIYCSSPCLLPFLLILNAHHFSSRSAHVVAFSSPPHHAFRSHCTLCSPSRAANSRGARREHPPQCKCWLLTALISMIADGCRITKPELPVQVRPQKVVHSQVERIHGRRIRGAVHCLRIQEVCNPCLVYAVIFG